MENRNDTTTCVCSTLTVLGWTQNNDWQLALALIAIQFI